MTPAPPSSPLRDAKLFKLIRSILPQMRGGDAALDRKTDDSDGRKQMNFALMGNERGEKLLYV